MLMLSKAREAATLASKTEVSPLLLSVVFQIILMLVKIAIRTSCSADQALEAIRHPGLILRGAIRRRIRRSGLPQENWGEVESAILEVGQQLQLAEMERFYTEAKSVEG